MLTLLLSINLTIICFYAIKKPHFYLRISSFILLLLLSFYHLITTYTLIYTKDFLSLTYLNMYILSLSFITLSFFAEKNISSLSQREFVFIPVSLTLGLLILLYSTTINLFNFQGLFEINVLLFVEILSLFSFILIPYLSSYSLRRSLNAYFPFGAILILQLTPKTLQGETTNIISIGTLILFFIIHFFMIHKFHLPQKTLYHRLGILLFIYLTVLHLYSFHHFYKRYL